MRYFLLFFSLLFACDAFSQSYRAKENNVWTFGAYEALDFNKKPVEDRTSLAFNHFAIGSVCDTSGKLQFYTEGTNIFYADGTLMPNGAEVTPGTYIYLGFPWTPTEQSTHGVQIIPVPGAPKKYYVFTTLGYYQRMVYGWNYYWGHLYYTVVDMSLNNGKGDVVQGKKAIKIDSAVAMPLAGVVGEKCNTYWLIAHDRYTNEFKSYAITDTGVTTTPVVSATGNLGFFGYGYGAITVAPNRKKIALNSFEGNLELMDFDASTGIVSNPVTMQAHTCDGAAAAFSPDNTKLYAMVSVPSPIPGPFGGATLSIAQFDLSGPNPTLPVIVSNGGFSWADIRLGPDGKIYSMPYGGAGSGTGKESLGRIEFPNIAGVKCTFTTGVVRLRYGYASFVFPNEIPTWNWKYQYANSSTDIIICRDDSIKLKATNIEGESYNWENGAGAINRVVNATGKYIVTYKNLTSCTFYADTFKVKELDSVRISLGPDTTVCDQQPYVLKSDAPAAAFLWSNGSTAETYTVNNAGSYWLQVTTADGCIGADTVAVRFIDLAQQLGNDTVVCRNDIFNIQLQANVPDGASALWSNGSADPFITVTDTGIYSVKVSFGSQCSEEDAVHIIGKSCNCHVGMPTAFTPNGDGRNDRYRVVLQPGCIVHSIKLSVYNRWGQLVFISSDPSESWGGNFNGKPCDIGTYLYVLQGVIGDDMKEVFEKGEIQLIR